MNKPERDRSRACVSSISLPGFYVGSPSAGINARLKPWRIRLLSSSTKGLLSLAKPADDSNPK